MDNYDIRFFYLIELEKPKNFDGLTECFIFLTNTKHQKFRILERSKSNMDAFFADWKFLHGKWCKWNWLRHQANFATHVHRMCVEWFSKVFYVESIIRFIAFSLKCLLWKTRHRSDGEIKDSVLVWADINWTILIISTSNERSEQTHFQIIINETESRVRREMVYY